MFVSGYLISFLNKCNTEEKSHLCTIRLKKNMIYFFFFWVIRGSTLNTSKKTVNRIKEPNISADEVVNSALLFGNPLEEPHRGFVLFHKLQVDSFAFILFIAAGIFAQLA